MLAHARFGRLKVLALTSLAALLLSGCTGPLVRDAEPFTEHLGKEGLIKRML